ncbi:MULTISPECIES: GNAT family N-acetyltransferase [unclassified Curtobacterium]|uniref:GNAT family N-acetyltransferase n=1 Tax=unclassified Curtobacterium TaxID=257496 RepID=UPI003A8138BA
MTGSSFVVRAAARDEAAACIELWTAAVAARDGVPRSAAVRDRARSKFAAARVALVVASSPSSAALAGSVPAGSAPAGSAPASPAPAGSVSAASALAGFALVTEPGTGLPGDPDDAAYLSLLAVDPRAQGHGLGRSLLQRAVAEAGAAGYARTLLHALDDNAPALRLYRGAGFEPVGEPFPHALSGRPTRAWVADGARTAPATRVRAGATAARPPHSATGPTSPGAPRAGTAGASGS